MMEDPVDLSMLRRVAEAQVRREGEAEVEVTPVFGQDRPLRVVTCWESMQIAEAQATTWPEDDKRTDAERFIDEAQPLSGRADYRCVRCGGPLCSDRDCVEVLMEEDRRRFGWG